MAVSARLAAALFGLFALIASAQAGKSGRGDGTAYSGDYDMDATGFNSCQFKAEDLPDHYQRYYGALPSQVFNKASDCGMCIRVRGTDAGASGEWIKIMIVDECASCQGNGDVDLSTSALSDATGFSWDRKGIEWEEVSCDESAPEASTSSVDEEAAAANSTTPAEEEDMSAIYQCRSECYSTKGCDEKSPQSAVDRCRRRCRKNCRNATSNRRRMAYA